MAVVGCPDPVAGQTMSHPDSDDPLTQFIIPTYVYIISLCPHISTLSTSSLRCRDQVTAPDCESVVAGDVDDEGSRHKSLRRRVATSELVPIPD